MVGSQATLDSPMPWIGMYVAAASLVCSVAMFADFVHGIVREKYWFRCKYFTINAASLTALAVAMKLPVDLTTDMEGTTDTLAKLSSSGFMIIVMGNFLISFASMSNEEIFMNIVALGILVITIIVNTGIQLYTWKDNYFLINLRILHIVSMIVLFVTMISSVLTVTTTKKYMDLKYNELHETACEGGKLEETGGLTHLKLKEVVEKYWVMAETGNPQFVMARSVSSAMPGAICLVTAYSLIRAGVCTLGHPYPVPRPSSPYRWSIVWIFAIQSIGVFLGAIAPVYRWFIGIGFNCNNILTDPDRKKFKLVETYWIQRVVEWKETPLSSQVRGVKCKIVIGNVKMLFLNICIGVQIGIVVASKLVQFITVVITLPLFSCFYYCKRMKEEPVFESNALTNNGSSQPELDLYVLRLDGEAKFPKFVLRNMCHELNQVIQMGKSRQPKNLAKLLQKSDDNFKGVANFDSNNHVPNCWTMSVVNLTSIAVALPNIESRRVDQLISGVSEGLLYANLVMESFSAKGDNMLKLKYAADFMWERVEMHRKWLDKDLRKLPLEGKTIEGSLQILVEIAEKAAAFHESQRSVTGCPKVEAANSMNRISQTILNDYEGNREAYADGKLFEQLSIMIADILGACLSNLPRVIIRKCYCNTVEERDKSVRRAAHLLGETEEILGILEHHQLPSLSGDRAAYIDEWRAYMMQMDPPTIVPSSNNETLDSGSGELHINVADETPDSGSGELHINVAE